MANPKVQIDVTLNDKATDGLRSLSTTMKQMGRDISIVSRELILVSSAITGGMAVAFSKAQKDIPAVANELKLLSNSFQSMSDSVSTAALPSLQQFSNFMNNVAISVRDFSSTHQEFVNSVVKGAGAVLALATGGYALGQAIKAGAAALRLFNPLLTELNILLGVTKLQFWIVALSVLALADAFLILSRVDWMTNLKNFATGGFLGFSAGGNAAMMKGLIDKLKEWIDTMKYGVQPTIQRTSDALGHFGEGFQDTIKRIDDSMKELGTGIATSLEKGFSDTIFNTITGKFKDLRTVALSLVDDIAHAFSKMAAERIMFGLFNADPSKGNRGPLAALGDLLGLNKTTKQFGDLTENMKHFGKEKDKVIDKLKKFGKGLDASEGNKVAGTPGGGSGGSLSIDIGSFLDATKVTGSLNAMLAGTLGLVAALGTGFDAVGMKIIKMGITYAVTQIGMVAVSLAAAIAEVAIGTATAAALAAVWVIPALLASIATLGGAAAIGAAALGAALGASGGMVAAGFGAAAGGGGLPAGANITMGSGAFTKGATGGIVTRPTMALIGEAGPEAVVPLNKAPGAYPLGRGGSNVTIQIDTALLNSPSNMMDFVRLLKQELAR